MCVHMYGYMQTELQLFLAQAENQVLAQRKCEAFPLQFNKYESCELDCLPSFLPIKLKKWHLEIHLRFFPLNKSFP